MANFDDFDPLMIEPAVRVDYVNPRSAIPGDLDLLIIPGTKATLSDLAFLREQGWHIDIAAHVRRGGRVLGICGGFQMLGRAIHDPAGLEGTPGTCEGLDYLDVTTTLLPQKHLRPFHGRSVAGGHAVHGYEMHLGVTDGPGTEWPFLQREDGVHEGATTALANVTGCYVHGLFANDAFRRALLASFGAAATARSFNSVVDESLDEIAQVLERSLSIDKLLELATRRDAVARG